MGKRSDIPTAERKAAARTKLMRMVRTGEATPEQIQTAAALMRAGPLRAIVLIAENAELTPADVEEIAVQMGAVENRQ